jgi:hypothetical protein
MYTADAVCDYLREDIFPQIAPPPYGEIQITELPGGKPVYLFFEPSRNIMVVGKVFEHEYLSSDEAWVEAEKELLNLKLLRESFGMNTETDQVVAPLGNNRELSAMLVTEKAPGQSLDYYLKRAIFELHYDELFEKLSFLARFFVKLHQCSETERTVPQELPRWYLERLLNTLSIRLNIPCQRSAIEEYAIRWWGEDRIFNTDREVIVHGDATPTNFFFNNTAVVGIDLEKMKWADRCWDLGFIAAELKHHFMWRMGNGWSAEPFVGHFLWEYAAYYGKAQFFCTITSKIPLYMALGLLRIARNNWLDETHRRNLIEEAKRCLEYGLSPLIATVR